jgi:hypothetical protein
MSDRLNNYRINRKARIIGINEYDRLPPLRFCKSNVDELANILCLQRYIILDVVKDRVNLHRASSTIETISNDENIQADDVLLFYFSGYVSLNSRSNDISIIGSDFSGNPDEGLPFSIFLDKIKHSQFTKTMTVLDCYYDEDDIRTKFSLKTKEASGMMKNIINTKLQEREHLGDEKYLIGSIQSFEEYIRLYQSEYAGLLKQCQTSLFTHYLVEGLKGAHGQSVDEQGRITPFSLNEYIQNINEFLKETMIRNAHVKDDKKNLVLAQYPTYVSQS